VGALTAIVVANGDIVVQGIRIVVQVANKVLAPVPAPAPAPATATAIAPATAPPRLLLLLLGPVLEDQSILMFMPLGIVHYPTLEITGIVESLQKVV